jgi:mannosylglycoprotein endo-beta-mannosidase
VSEEENEMLTAPFSEEEVKMAVFDMERNKAPGPDGFPADFYQFFWEVVKPDLMNFFMNSMPRDCLYIA